MFIRIKTIKGKPYAYLVENKWKRGEAKQSVKRYLGRIYSLPEKPAPTIPADIQPPLMLHSLIKNEIADKDFKIDFNARTVRKGASKAVLQLNGGFFCDKTMRELYRALHERHEVKPGIRLARAFSDAGIRISHKDFVKLYKGYHP